MKTSNIIIIAFVIFIIGGMLFLFVDSKKHKEDAKNNILFKKFALPAFSVVVAEKGSNFRIERSNSMSIKVEYSKNTILPKNLYTVINDTLHIYCGLWISVKCKQITAIIGNNPAWVSVSNFTPDSLTIKMNGGKLNYNVYRSNKETKFNQKLFNLDIIANDSARIVIDNARFLRLSIKSDNAKIINNCCVKYANATLSNKAEFLSLDKITNLVVEKDSSCHVQISNQNVY